MNRKELEGHEIRFCFGFIPNDPTNPYFMVADRLQVKGLVVIGKYSAENWGSLENNVAINSTYSGLKVMRTITQTAEFAIVYELAQHEGTPANYIRGLLPSCKIWGDDVKKRVEGTKFLQRANYLKCLVAARAKEKDKRWLYTDESQNELKLEVTQATAKSHELLSGLSPYTATDFPRLLEPEIIVIN